jgi:serine/threonine protein kinase
VEISTVSCPGDDQISRFIEGRLTSDDADRIQAHLDRCAACRTLVAGAAELPRTRSTSSDSNPPLRLARPEFRGTSRFRVIRRIGAGGMGVVYEAEDRERGQLVALKTLRTADSHTLYRLKREFRALADLHHPNLVSLYELVVDEECFFTMELLHGTDFLGHVGTPSLEPPVHAPTLPASHASLDKAPTAPTIQAPYSFLPFDGARLRRVLPQLIEGLTALHAAGKIHRDVKPSNVIVTSDGRAVLVDFGLVSQTDPLTPQSLDGHIVGTVSYMAPEQCRGELRLQPAADFYAVGVMLYEALTGRLPFDGSAMQVLVEKQQHDPPGPLELRPGIPADLAALCVDLMKRAPEERPSGAQILRRLGVETRKSRSSSEKTRSAHFAGREDELGRLKARLHAMARGEAVAMLVRGPSGIGKTSLCQRFLDLARSEHPDLVVLQGRCYERESVPYQAMDSLIDHLSQYWLGLSPKDAAALLPREAALLSRLFPVLGRVPCIAEAPRAREIANPQEQRTRAFAALRELLQRLGERHPVALILDDMQWVDGNTLAVLSDLMRPPDPPRLLLLLSTRPEEEKALEEVVRRMDASAETIDLAPLPERAATELAEELLGSRDLAGEVAREAGGNPFFIGELVQFVQTVDPSSLGSVRLEEVIAQRISQLSETCRRLLQLVALAGEPIARRTLGSALGISPAEVATEAGVLRPLRFIRAAGALADERVEPYHDRVRDAALASLDEGTRRAHHRALAIAYEQRADVSEEQLARHWRGAGEHGRAAEHARKAADQAHGRLDFDRAAGLYRIAIELGNPDGDARRELFTLLGGALANAGRAREAAQSLLAATEGAEPATSIELRRRSAEELLRGGYLDEGLAAIRAVLLDFGLHLARTPLGALLSILLRRAWLRLRGLRWRQRSVSELRPTELAKIDVLDTVATGLGFVDLIRGFDYQARCLVQSLRLGEPDRLARSLAREAAYLAGVGQVARARKVLMVTDRAVAQSRGQYAAAFASLGRGIVIYYSGEEWRSAYEEFVTAERLFLAQGRAGWEVDTAQLHQSFSLLHQGELAELSRRIPSYIREAERRGDQYASVNLRTRLGVIWLARDDVARAEQDLEAALASWMPPEKGFFVQHFWAMLGRGENALYAGEAEKGAAQLAESAPGLKRSQLLRVPLVRIEVADMQGRLALAQAAQSNDPRLAQNHLATARECVRRLERERMPLARKLSRLLLATVAQREGHPREARQLLEEVIVSLVGNGMMLHAAAARRRLGELLDGEAGAALLAEADSWYAAQGVRNPARLTEMLIPGWS